MVGNGSVESAGEARALWRVSLEEEPEDDCRRKPCLMVDAPLEMFICPQVACCSLECAQKEEQEKNRDWVYRQRLKIRMLVDRSMQSAGDAHRD